MLVDQQHSDILSLLREVLKCLFNRLSVGLRVHDKKVPLGIWAVGDVLRTCELLNGFCRWESVVHTPMPARRRPVTELEEFSDAFRTGGYRMESNYSSSPMTARNCRS